MATGMAFVAYILSFLLRYILLLIHCTNVIKQTDAASTHTSMQHHNRVVTSLNAFRSVNEGSTNCRFLVNAIDKLNKVRETRTPTRHDTKSPGELKTRREPYPVFLNSDYTRKVLRVRPRYSVSVHNVQTTQVMHGTLKCMHCAMLLLPSPAHAPRLALHNLAR